VTEARSKAEHGKPFIPVAKAGSSYVAGSDTSGYIKINGKLSPVTPGMGG